MPPRRLPRPRLQGRYTLAILSLVTGVVALLSVLLMVQFHFSALRMTETAARLNGKDLLDQLIERGAAMNGSLAENIVDSLYADDRQGMEELLHSSYLQQDVVAAIIVDERGRIVHDGSGETRRVGEIFSAPGLHDVLGPASAESSTRTDGGRVHFSHAVHLGKELLGATYLALSMKETDARIEASTSRLQELTREGLGHGARTALGSGLVVLLIGVFVAHSMANGLTRPIRKIARFAAEIGEGRYPEPLGLRRDDELGDLADAFDEMSGSLRDTADTLHHMAYHDSLTGLPNRTRFLELLEQALKRSDGRSGAVMFIDLDHFKRINDTLGHRAGDELLSEVATRLSAVLDADGADNRLARLGGDEFTALLPHIEDRGQASETARRMLETLGRPFTLADRSVTVGASIGISLFPADGRDPVALLKSADLALYCSKEAGRNTYHYFVETMHERAMAGLEREEALLHALENDEFELHYQAQVGADGRRVIGAEALLRWRHPEHGLIAPAEFVEAAERSGLIVALGRHVLRLACRDAASWHEAGFDALHVSVNVSAIQLGKPAFIGEVVDALASASLPARALHVELTESSLMHDEQAAEQLMESLSETGVEVWMDDFGTGYASLSHLRRLPFRGVKIDGSLVHDIAEEAGDRAIVVAAIAMARSLGIHVVAEGVETECQRVVLGQAGCARMQGFLFGRPMSSEAFLAELHRREAGLESERRAAG